MTPLRRWRICDRAGGGRKNGCAKGETKEHTDTIEKKGSHGSLGGSEAQLTLGNG